MKKICWHKFTYQGFEEAYNFSHDVRYSVRYYRCEKCGKEIKIDGRVNQISNTHNPIYGWFVFGKIE